MAQSDYERYFEDQKMQGVNIARLQRAYSFLGESHRELMDSYKKIKKREKKRDKFFIKI